VEEEFAFKPSAFKHGIAKEDILNAFKRRVLDGDVINVFHAMKCRKAYLALLRVKGME